MRKKPEPYKYKEFEELLDEESSLSVKDMCKMVSAEL